MKKEMIIAISVVTAILFGGITLSEINKQNNERIIAQDKIAIEREKLEYEKEKDRKAEADISLNKMMLDACLKDAENAYWDWAELNGTGKRDGEGGVTMSQYKWDRANENKKSDINDCYRKYSN